MNLAANYHPCRPEICLVLKHCRHFDTNFLAAWRGIEKMTRKITAMHRTPSAMPNRRPSSMSTILWKFRHSCRCRKLTFLGGLAWLLFGSLRVIAALPLTESTFTEIIQEANVVNASTKSVAPALAHDLFKSPDLVRTGQGSRAELTAKDLTITRIGENTTFSYAPSGREIELKQGSVLFHAPVGIGGGAIKNRGSSAAVLGTTEIGAVLPDGSYKVLCLEGTVTVTLANGKSTKLKPGQFVVVTPDGTQFGETMDFNLGDLADRLQLVAGFSQALSSWHLIEMAIAEQNQQIATGKLVNVVFTEVASFGLDIRYRALNDLPFYSRNGIDEGNPLDFPGMGGIGWPPNSPILPPGLPIGYTGVINPPRATDTNPPAAPLKVMPR